MNQKFSRFQEGFAADFLIAIKQKLDAVFRRKQSRRPNRKKDVQRPPRCPAINRIVFVTDENSFHIIKGLSEKLRSRCRRRFAPLDGAFAKTREIVADFLPAEFLAHGVRRPFADFLRQTFIF